MTTETTYLLGRNGQQHGPYTLDQLRQMAAQGQTHPEDVVWAAGMSNWMPLADVVRYAPPTAPPPIPGVPGAADTPRPPSLHWAIVFVLTLVTFGIFGWIWMFVQAWWIKKIDAKPKAIYLLAIGLPAAIVIAFIAESIGSEGLSLLSNFITWAVIVVAYFDMRAAIETRFNMQLSGVMTFFFGLFYLQYHMRKIAHGQQEQATGRLLT